MEKFYTLHVKSGHEAKVRDLLVNRATKTNMWKQKIFDILIPTEKEYATRRGKRQVIDTKVFPGYVFIQMYLDKESEALVHGTDGVIGFVTSGNKPVVTPAEEIEKIMKKLAVSKDSVKSNYKSGEAVTIIAGPFADFTGKIDTVEEAKGRLKAYVSIFGRDTLVELGIQDVQKLV